MKGDCKEVPVTVGPTLKEEKMGSRSVAGRGVNNIGIGPENRK